MNQVLYEYLCDVARRSDCVSYADAGAQIDLDMQSDADRGRIARLLDEISEHEHAQGRPLLSAIVIRVDTNMPGDGFFTMAQRVGRFMDADEQRFWIQELQRVHDQWGRSSS